MERPVERAEQEHPLLEKVMLEAAFRSALAEARARSGFRYWTVIREIPVKILVLLLGLSLSGGIAAALIHSNLASTAQSLFRGAGF